MSPKLQNTTGTVIRSTFRNPQCDIWLIPYPIFLILRSEYAPFLRYPLIQKHSETTHNIYDPGYYPSHYSPAKKNRISEPPTFLTRGGYQVFTTADVILAVL
jgi:hypothetical protein